MGWVKCLFRDTSLGWKSHLKPLTSSHVTCREAAPSSSSLPSELPAEPSNCLATALQSAAPRTSRSNQVFGYQLLPH